ncbi:MAG: flagellin, partial [Clostridia bacterium]|nr:flagellin [Clostridia bacterium]
DGDDLLEARELAEIVVDLSDLSTGLGVNTEFVIEVKPPTGGVLVIERTTPPRLEQVMDLG